MKTLAARGLNFVEKSRVMKAVAIAAPMVLLECHGPSQMPPARAVVVTIEPPSGASSAEAAPEPHGKATRQAEANAISELRTELNVDFYDGCVLRARLSVINSDGSLNRVILDPKVDFTLIGSASSATGTICSQSEECDISAIAAPTTKYGLRTGIAATFAPSQDSGLSASSAVVPLQGAEPRQYCP